MNHTVKVTSTDGTHIIGRHKTFAASKANAENWLGDKFTWTSANRAVSMFGDVLTISGKATVDDGSDLTKDFRVHGVECDQYGWECASPAPVASFDTREEAENYIGSSETLCVVPVPAQKEVERINAYAELVASGHNSEVPF